MSHTLARQDLYQLVWTEPLRVLAPRFGVSDVALKKACVRAHVPTPDRGYWAKLEAGKRVVKAALPLRPPGMDAEVQIGGPQQWYRQWTPEELLGPIPPPPEFEESLEALRARIEAGIGKVSSRTSVWHAGVRKLLDQDEARRQKAAASSYISSWDQPIFASAIEQRRLRILNSLFLAVGRFGGKATLRGREAREIHVTFDRQHVNLSLERAKAPSRATADAGARDRLTFSILSAMGSTQTRATWTDSQDARLEDQLTTITAELVLTAEIQLREGAERVHLWRIERKAELEERERQRIIEGARLQQEQRERLEQARIDGLLKAADDFRKATEIRAYVAALGDVLGDADNRRDRYAVWSAWALAQADRIDPALFNFDTAMADMDDVSIPEPGDLRAESAFH